MQAGAVHLLLNGCKVLIMHSLVKKKLRCALAMQLVSIDDCLIPLQNCRSIWSHPLHRKENEELSSFLSKEIVGSLPQEVRADIIRLPMKQPSWTLSAPYRLPMSMRSSAMRNHLQRLPLISILSVCGVIMKN